MPCDTFFVPTLTVTMWIVFMIPKRVQVFVFHMLRILLSIHVNHYLGAVATLAFSRRVWNQTLCTFRGKVCKFRVCICNLGSVFRGKVCNLGSVFPGIAYQGPSCIPWACRIRGMVCKICQGLYRAYRPYVTCMITYLYHAMRAAFIYPQTFDF